MRCLRVARRPDGTVEGWFAPCGPAIGRGEGRSSPRFRTHPTDWRRVRLVFRDLALVPEGFPRSPGGRGRDAAGTPAPDRTEGGEPARLLARGGVGERPLPPSICGDEGARPGLAAVRGGAGRGRQPDHPDRGLRSAGFVRAPLLVRPLHDPLVDLPADATGGGGAHPASTSIVMKGGCQSVHPTGLVSFPIATTRPMSRQRRAPRHGLGTNEQPERVHARSTGNTSASSSWSTLRVLRSAGTKCSRKNSSGLFPNLS